MNFFQIKLTFSIWTRFHIHSFSPSHLMKFILAFGPRHFFFLLFHCQIPVSLSKQSDCQVSRCEEFPYRAPPSPPLTLLTPARFRHFGKSDFSFQFCCGATARHRGFYLLIILGGISSESLVLNMVFSDKLYSHSELLAMR